MELICPSCRTPFQTADLNAELAVASCRSCGAVTELRAARPVARAKVPLPGRFVVTETAGALEVAWRWFTPLTLFALCFTIAWDAFLLFWYFLAWAVPGTPWMMWVFPAGHIAVGAFVTYWTAAQLLNRTRVEVGFDHLRVAHGPVPLRKAVALRAGEISQIFCDEQKKRTRGGFIVTYAVNALVRGKKVRIVRGLEDRQQALYLEQVIERRLRISDAPVPGELPADGAAA